MNRLYTLEGYENQTVGNILSAFFKMPKIALPVLAMPKIIPPPPPVLKIAPPSVPVPKIPTVKISQAPIVPKIPAVKISQAPIAPKIPAVKISTPSVVNALNVPNKLINNQLQIANNAIKQIKPPSFLNAKLPKNPFGKPRKDQSSSYDDFQNEIDSQREVNYAPEPNYPQQQQEEMNQSNISQETNEIPVYGYDYNDVMGAYRKKITARRKINKSSYTMGALKLPKLKLPKLPTKKKSGLNIGKTLSKQLIPAKGLKVKVTPQEAKKALGVIGGTAAIIATAGTASPVVAGLAAASGIGAASLTAGAGTIATASALGSTLLANGSGAGVSGLLNTAGALLNNPVIQQNVPLAQSANQAINTGLNYYNTGAGIAESLGLTPPSLGTTSEEFLSLLANKDRGLQNLSDQITPQPSPLNPFKNPLTDPTSPIYMPPIGNKTGGQAGQNQIITSDKTNVQPKTDNSNLMLIAGIGLLGYLFINRKKGKK